MSHRALVFRTENEGTLPKTKGTVLFERGHKTNDSLVLEKRELPLDRFVDIWAARVHDFAQSFQDRAGKGRSSDDITVNARIFFSHNKKI